jgi:hypothetical protein
MVALKEFPIGDRGFIDEIVIPLRRNERNSNGAGAI